MRPVVLRALFALLAAAPLARAQERPAAPSATAAREEPRTLLERLDRDICDVVARARASAAHVVVRRTIATDAGPQRDQIATSAIVWSADGLVVSLGRAFENADAIEVTVPSGETRAAELVNTDEETGIALLRIAPAGLREPLRPATLGSAKDLRVGSIVVAVSSPFGLVGSAAVGNIAGVDRIVKRGRMALTDVLQISTPVNPGDPGGLLVDARGELVGVVASTYERSILDSDAISKMYRDLVKFGENLFQRPAPDDLKRLARADDARFAGTALPFGAQGIGFAIPVEEVRAVVERLKAGPLAERGYLGVQVVPADPAGEAEGVVVVGVKEASPADRAGLRHDDVVLRYDGHPVTSVYDFKRLVLDTPVGRAVKIEARRGDAELRLEVVLERRGRKP
jgi:serine protease Do